MFSYARRDLWRNPRRTLATLVGVVLGVGLFSGVLFFIDGSGASMTKRAIAPVAIDLQRVSTSPLGEGLRLQQRLVQRGEAVGAGPGRMELTVRNGGPVAAHEVVVNDKLPPGLDYVRSSAVVDGKPIADAAGESPFAHGPGQIGLNIGSVPPGATMRLSYRVRSLGAAAGAGGAPLAATISSREDVTPNPANRPAIVSPNRLRERIAAIGGVAVANRLSFIQLPPGSLSAGGRTIERPIEVFGFDDSYARQYPAIDVLDGSLAGSGAVLSAEASRSLGARTGDRVRLTVPGSSRPARLPVSGTADLSSARVLFNSRQGLKLEDFLYVPDSIVISPAAFDRIVLPAVRRAVARRGTALAVKSPPTLEVDVSLDRAPLDSDPARALKQTQGVAREVKGIARGQDFVLDNVSNTLTVARADAAVAKRMFLFLGLPGLLLAGFLAAYAGTILAASQRREQANLRLRGAGPAHLLRILAYRTMILAGVGSALGAAAGFASILIVLGPTALLEASPTQLATSALIALGAGLLATGSALFVPGWRALRRDVGSQRREWAEEQRPRWRRLRLDYAGVAVAAGAAYVAVRGGAFDAPAGAVSTGQSTSLRSQLLVLPLGVWFAGTLLSVRAFEGVASRLPHPAPPRFGGVVRGILARTLSRRSRNLVTGAVGVSLVVGFGIGLAIFASTYDSAKAADAEFTVGSNLRITPSPASNRPHPASFVRKLEVDGVSAATPVVAGLENSFMRSRFNSDVQDLAAIDPVSYAQTAALSDEMFPVGAAKVALDALRTTPRSVLLNAETAAGLKLEVGDRAEILLARGTRSQQLERLTVVGVFDRFPGFPEGLDIVADLGFYQRRTGLEGTDFFLARTTDSSPAGLEAAVAAVQSGAGTRDRLGVETTETTFNKDQSSLTALNVRGLVDLDSAYTLAISTAVIAIFVFGLMLQRRREYVVLRAQGLGANRLQLLILGEAGFVALGGLIGGALVGVALGLLLVQVLEPLFILSPRPVIPLGEAALLAGLVALATLASAAAALSVLRRLSPSEVLREQ